MNFQQPLIQSSVPHDPSEIILICWFSAQETLLLLLVLKTVILQHYILYNIMYVFSITFSQFNAPLLNKNISINPKLLGLICRCFQTMILES